MLSVSQYPQAYVDGCRAQVDAQVSAYADLVAAAGPALDAFEPVFFNNMVIVLDHYFCHRSRTTEKKDGNPLNEVRVLCNSLMENDGVMVADKTIRLKPETSLLKHAVGDEIGLGKEDFVLLSNAFFAELENKFS
jgi:hypothetical protein